jgi:hypothetical protein
LVNEKIFCNPRLAKLQFKNLKADTDAQKLLFTRRNKNITRRKITFLIAISNQNRKEIPL